METKKNLCIALGYLLILAVVISIVTFSNLLYIIPDTNVLKTHLINLQEQYKIPISVPQSDNNVLRKRIEEKLENDNFNAIFTLSSKDQQFYYSSCKGRFVFQKEICQTDGDIQSNIQTIQKISLAPLILGRYQFVQILELNYQNVSQNIKETIQSIRIPPSMFYVSKRHLIKQQIDENYKQLQKADFQLQYQSLRSLKYFHNCDYTHLACDQTIFLISKNAKEVQSINQNIFFLNGREDIAVQNILLMKYNFHLIQSELSKTIDIWYRIEVLKLIKQSLKTINYINNVLDSQNKYILQKEQLQQIIKWILATKSSIDCILQKKYEEGWQKLKERPQGRGNSRIGRINLFAKDYKIGLYIPLLVCFGYPLVLILKSLIMMLLKKKIANKQKSE